MWLGIDFGTSLSSAAFIKDGIPVPVKMGANLTSLPSSVYVKDADTLVVGQTAENLRRRDPSRYKREFKLDLGTRTPYQMGGCEFLPERLVTEVLRRLKREAQEQSLNGESLEAAVITVPANYAKNKRELMRQAALDAGFTRAELLPEPVAAATYFAARNSAIQDGEIILVYDLGGGTFDAALIQKQSGGKYLSLATPVGARCGGVDFDRLIFNKLLKTCGESLQSVLKLNDKTGMAARLVISDFCRDIKHRLTEEDEVEEPIPLREAAPDDFFVVAREEFNRMIAPMIEETCNLCRQLVEKAEIDQGQVSRVLLVGGSCRIPYVREAVKDALKRPVVRVDDPELAVCLGAAVYAETKLGRAENQAAKVKEMTDLNLLAEGLTGELAGTIEEGTNAVEAKPQPQTPEPPQFKWRLQNAAALETAKTQKALVTTAQTNSKETNKRAELVVCPNGTGQYKSIYAAMREAQAGSKIIIRPGTYYESLTLDKQLEIVGDGRLDRIIIESHYAPCITMKTKRATVRGLTLLSLCAVEGQKLYAVDMQEGELQLIDCDIRSDSASCINVNSSAAHPTISSCTIHGGKQVGLLFNQGARGTVEDCEIFENEFSGVEIAGGSSALLTRCKIHHSAAGVLVHSKGFGELRHCEIFYNKQCGIEVKGGGTLEARETLIRNHSFYGVYAHEGGGATVRMCKLEENAGGNWKIEAGCEVKRSGNIESETKQKALTSSQTEEAILNILKSYTFGPYFYLYPNISEYKLANAREVCNIPSDEKILGLFDNTAITGNAKVCTLIGCKGVYSRASFGAFVTAIPYTEFKNCHFTADKTYSVSTGNGKQLDASVPSCPATKLAAMLNEIKKLFEK